MPISEFSQKYNEIIRTGGDMTRRINAAHKEFEANHPLPDNCRQCSSCPFGFSDMAEQAINYGCLPSVGEIMAIKRQVDLNWGCHSAEPGAERLCHGFARFCREHGVEYRNSATLNFNDFTNNGVEGVDFNKQV